LKRTIITSDILHLLAAIIVSHSAFTQPPPIQFQHLTAEHGLSNNRVQAITQDKYGLIWIGTQDGLNRFDGYKADVYQNERGNKKSLPNNYVRCLFTDLHGTVWIGTSNGLAYYDSHSNSFQSFFYDSNDVKSLPDNTITAINEDTNGMLWIGTYRGLCSFDIKSKRFTRFVHDDHPNSISGNYIRDIEFAPDGAMWITTNKGLNRLDLTTMKFTSFFHDPNDTTTLSDNTLTKMDIDQNGNLWVSVNETIYLECFNTRTHRVTHFKHFTEEQSHIPNNHPRDIFVDNSGRLWVGTQAEGLYLFLPDKNDFYQFKADLLDPDKLQSNTVVGFCQDNSGMIWLATHAYAERFNPDESKFISYRLKSNTTQYFANFPAYAITEDSSHRLWVGTGNGIYILDRQTGTITNYQRNQKDPHSLSSNHIQSLCFDRWGKMWIGTMSGLDLFDPVKKNFRKMYSKKDTARGVPFITSLGSDKNGDLLIGGRAGLSVYNFKIDSVYTLLNHAVQVIYEDNSGTLWIGTEADGLIKYNRLTGKKDQFKNMPDDTSTLVSSRVFSITQDHKGQIWIATTAGLCRYNATTRAFITFSEKHGLPHPFVTQLLVDDKDRIWMRTKKGISMLNESRTAFTNYDTGDLQELQGSQEPAFKTHDGYFCYASPGGFKMFHPDSIKKNPNEPPIILKRITIFDEPLKMDSSYSNLKSLKLSYKQNFFSFEFAALNFDHPEKNQFACQLIGFDKKMVHLGTTNRISYTNVPPNKYKLKVIASNNDGVWNKTGYELNLTIIAPFWATWWFRTIMVAAFIGAVFLYIKLRENRIRKEQAHQTAMNRQIAEIRMIALRAQMNPHFIFNSLNSIQHLISMREKGEAINYLSKFSRLIRRILENSLANTVSINNELELLELYIQLEQLRFDNKFEYHIAIDEKIDRENTGIPPLLIQPYVENAILHGLINKDGKGDLWLSLEKNNGLLICKIEDNGIGRAMAQEIEQKKVLKHKALGIKVTNERISTLSSLLDYKMEVVIEDLFAPHETAGETAQPAGTRVTISIPVKEVS
jgi:ligand-binding sensor domain-containing protein